jgi:hypothetical protein
MTHSTKLLVNEVNSNLKFLRKVNPMDETAIKNFIRLTINMRVDTSNWPWNPEKVAKLVNEVYSNL